MASTNPKEVAKLLHEIRQSSSQQRKEARNQKPQTLEGVTLQGILQLTETLQEWLPCLTEPQRIQLATGRMLGGARTLEQADIEERLFAYWWKNSDRDAFDLRMEVLLSEGVLRAGARSVIRTVRRRVSDRLIAEQLAPFEVLQWNMENLQRQQRLQGIDTGVEEAATKLSNEVLDRYSELLSDSDELVYGRLTVDDARLWVECCGAVRRGERGGLTPEDKTSEQLLRRVMQLFNRVRKNGYKSVAQLKLREDEVRNGGKWGRAIDYRKNSRGEWGNGLGQRVNEERIEVEHQVMVSSGEIDDVAMIRSYGLTWRSQKGLKMIYRSMLKQETRESVVLTKPVIGFSAIFADKRMQDVVNEISRASRVKKERG